MSRKITEIAIADIRIPEGRRALDPVKVKEIAGSIVLLGMLSPIGVRRHGDAPVELVWGGHRLAAKKGLGHKTIAAIAVDGLGWDQGHRETADLDDFVKMTEIAENLFRADLDVHERNEQLALWVALFEKIQQPISDAGTPIATKPGRKPSAAIAKVAKMSGLTTKTVKQAIKSTKVSPEVKAAADDAGLTSKQRLAIARLPEADQLAGVSKQAAINIVADRTVEAAAAKAPKPPQLAVLADDPAAPAADRAEANATAMAKPIDACDEMPDVEAPAGTTPAKQRRFNFIYRCSEAIAYGKQNGFDDAESEEITIEIIAAARHAADVWSALVFELERRRAGTPSQIVAGQPGADQSEQAAQRKAKRGGRRVAAIKARQPKGGA
jgi:hypothetical protein